LGKPVRGRGSSRALPALLAFGLLIGLAACGTRGDNGVGVAFIEDQAEDKAVRIVEISPPDSARDFTFPRQPEIVGQATSLVVSGRAGYLGRSLLLFQAEAFPDSGTVVDSAKVRLVFRDKFGDGPFTMVVHRVTSDWEEGRISPDSLPSFLAPMDTVEISFADQEVDTLTFRLDALAQYWTDSPDSNRGFLLAPVDGEADEIVFRARESTEPPSLTVWAPGVTVAPPPVRDTYVLETTAGFTPLPGQPGRLTVARGLAVRSNLRIEVPDLGPRATVNRAELVFRLDPAASSLDVVRAGVVKITGPWQADSTETETLLYGAIDVEADADSLVFEITALVRELQAEENLGFQIRAIDEVVDTDWFRVHGPDTADPSMAPRLKVWYTPGDTLGDGS
jgi:hypothetical protein